MSLTIQDLEKFQAQLSPEYEDYQIELQEGRIVIMGPSDIVSSEIGIRFGWLLMNWVVPRNLGRVFDSSGGFILSNQDLRAPDISFVCAERLRQSPRAFGELVPDLVVEIKSRTDRVKKITEKIQMFLELGARIGILIDPDKLTVTVYRASGEPTVFNNEDILTIPELFPGWELAISELWPPVFD
ncbi:Uma2 family endonuclease [Argonema antarcticum]|uniref:Uma2 family endonuclease n=1 Tax=Argonema antarcticum TaxID=2942763 RepID=UPI0020125B9A|nr:Uma2 family endonuclease [Argonema antarcticum]MCL1475891.1 Uma2 family endonuclease [Argonema antarcticum A004/B2]